MHIILGSQSPRRKKILEEMGYEVDVMPSHIDENAIRHDDPSKLALMLAHAKADALIAKITPPAILVTAYLIVEINDQIREKPLDVDEARQFLRECSQAECICIAGVVVTDCASKKRFEGTDRASVWFDPLPEALIGELIASGDVYGWGGGFQAFDPRMKSYISRFVGEPETIMGLPKTLTARLLSDAIT